MRVVSVPLHEFTAAQAYAELQRRLDEIRKGRSRDVQPRMRFAEFAASLLERKVLRNEIRSAKTRLTWRTALEQHLLPVFGEVYLDALKRHDIEEWLDDHARKVQDGRYSPVTVNGWYSILRVILNEATLKLESRPEPDCRCAAARCQRAPALCRGGAELADGRGAEGLPRPDAATPGRSTSR